MKKVKYVQKDKQVSGAGANYKAVTHDQVVSVAREALVEHGVVIYPEQLNGEFIVKRDLKQDIKMHLYNGNYAIHFVNMDNPEDRISVTIEAQANDNGDKAPGKAVTYATKTAILKVLCLETGENDESRAEQFACITEVQVKAINNILENLDPSITDRMLGSLNVDSVEEIPKKEYNQVIANLKATKKRQNANN